jgi:hypothetical protein
VRRSPVARGSARRRRRRGRAPRPRQGRERRARATRGRARRAPARRRGPTVLLEILPGTRGRRAREGGTRRGARNAKEVWGARLAKGSPDSRLFRVGGAGMSWTRLRGGRQGVGTSARPELVCGGRRGNGGEEVWWGDSTHVPAVSREPKVGARTSPPPLSPPAPTRARATSLPSQSEVRPHRRARPEACSAPLPSPYLSSTHNFFGARGPTIPFPPSQTRAPRACAAAARRSRRVKRRPFLGAAAAEPSAQRPVPARKSSGRASPHT